MRLISVRRKNRCGDCDYKKRSPLEYPCIKCVDGSLKPSKNELKKHGLGLVGLEIMTFEYFRKNDIMEVEEHIAMCQNMNHVQQVAYSTYYVALTQICFDCKKIRTNMRLN